MDTCGTYVFDVKHLQKGAEFRNALLFARQQLLQVIAKKGFNVLLLERWATLDGLFSYDADIACKPVGQSPFSGKGSSIVSKYSMVVDPLVH